MQRIAEIVKRKNKERLAKAAALAKKEAAGDFSHLKNKKGEFVHNPLPQPTLPNVSLDDEFDDNSSMRTRAPAPSTYTAQSDYYYRSDYKANYAAGVPDYPPAMPVYHPQQQPYAGYPSSIITPDDQNAQYDDEYSSTAHLPMAAAPIAHQDDPYSLSTTTLTNPYSYNDGYIGDPRDVYQRGAEGAHLGYGQSQQRLDHGYSQEGRPSSGLAYDDPQDYPSPTSGGPPARSNTASHAQYGQRPPPTY